MSINRRMLVQAGFSLIGGAAVAGNALAQEAMGTPNHTLGPGPHAEPFSQTEIVRAASGFFGSVSQGLASVIEKAFKDNGEPTGYIAGTEVGGGVVVGLRYGKGELYMKHRPRTHVFWQGPSAGFDFGASASRVFTLCYGLEAPRDLFHHYPGVDGSIFFVAGVGIMYQRADGITLAPIRTGVGARANASVDYTDYSRTRHIVPF